MEITLTHSMESFSYEIRIFRDRDSATSYKEYTLSITTNRVDQKKYRIPPDKIQYIFAAVYSARICPYTACLPIALDRESYDITIGEYWSKNSYHWHEPAPDGLKALSKIKDLLMNFAKLYGTDVYLAGRKQTRKLPD